MTLILPLVGLLLLVATAYWQLVIAEGTYLGPRVVALLYDWVASAYERVKQFDLAHEQWFLGLPLAQALDTIPPPFVLDAGTGTGRLPRALFFQPRFRGHVVGLDLSRRMLAQAARLTQPYASRITLIWQDAQTLPFLDDTFDAVTCLEVLEFTPDPKGVLRELVRVLRPGGILLVSNRIGPDAPLLPGRAFRRPAFETILQSLPLEEVQVQPWQVDYDLAWALKAETPKGGGVRSLPEVLRCPTCGHSPLPMRKGAYICAGCGRAYPVAEDGVIEMAWQAGRTRM
ncbi:MAG TPA: class I SAM-dependent methyltransferase [Chloroflexi bacterium]|nr:class I SAM-dependent methyltransferase [Chloroflexota bacterium]